MKRTNLEEMTVEQIRAIELSRERGEELARKHPEIAEGYRNGRTRKELAQRYSPDWSISI